MNERRRPAVALTVVIVLLAVGSGAAAVTGVGDVDGDGLSVATELDAGTDPLVADSDGDGLDDGRERATGTDPLVADTDGDGLVDGREVRALGSDPLEVDTDGDGLADGREVEDLGTDPTSPDSDGDGLTDPAEVRDYETDPVVADTDGDGLADGTEVDELWTDPTAADTDGDGLDDATELHTYGTDPREADSDGDRLQDGAEVTTHGTDPLAFDTDDDGLDDGREIYGTETDPTTADTDDDGLDDGREVETVGTDPADPDTDDDGIADGYETADTGPFADADPLRRDVFVELDYMRGERLSEDAIDLVQERFANAPLENPDGSTGVTLHVVVDDVMTKEGVTTPLDAVRLRARHFDNEGRGYHHALIVDDVERNGRALAGFATTGALVMQAGTDDGDYDDRVQAHILMHELGHSLGLSGDTYVGIDSTDVPFDDYPSSMNYDAPNDVVQYSQNGTFDDWAYLDANLHTPIVFDWRVPSPDNKSTTNASDDRTSTVVLATARGGAITVDDDRLVADARVLEPIAVEHRSLG